MSQSAIYIVNNSTQLVAENGIINLGTVIRKFGPNLNLSGNGVQIAGSGYYNVDINVTGAPTTTGEMIVTVLKDGVAIPGAIATETAAAAGDYVNLSISALIRESCYCCEGLSNLTIILTGLESNITNITTRVEKI